MSADTIADIDNNISIWRGQQLAALVDGDASGELEAIEEINLLLDQRPHLVR